MHKERSFLKILSLDMLMLCYSFNVSLIGQMFAPIKDAYFLTLSQASMLPALQNMSGFIAVILVILLMDFFNIHKIIAVAVSLYFCAFCIIGFLPPLFALFIVFSIMGISGGTFDSLTNPVMLGIAGRKYEKHINLMQMFFAMGAVIGPIISQWIYTHLGIKGVFTITGAFALIWAVSLNVTFREHFKHALVKQRLSVLHCLSEVKRVYKKAGIVQTVIITILHACWQFSAMLYISTAISSVNNDYSQGAVALSIFFLGMMLSRLLNVKLASRYHQGIILIFGSAAGVVFWVLAMLLPGLTAKIIFIGLSSLFCGSNFPAVITAAVKIAPNNAAAASGNIILSSFIGAFTFPPIVGYVGSLIDLNFALILAAIPLALIIVFAMQLYRKMGKVQ